MTNNYFDFTRLEEKRVDIIDSFAISYFNCEFRALYKEMKFDDGVLKSASGFFLIRDIPIPFTYNFDNNKGKDLKIKFNISSLLYGYQRELLVSTNVGNVSREQTIQYTEDLLEVIPKNHSSNLKDFFVYYLGLPKNDLFSISYFEINIINNNYYFIARHFEENTHIEVVIENSNHYFSINNNSFHKKDVFNYSTDLMPSYFADLLNIPFDEYLTLFPLENDTKGLANLLKDFNNIKNLYKMYKV